MTTPFIHLAESPLTRLSILDFGWGNGYVNLPPGHRWYGLHYDQIDVDVHGGLTFSAQIGEYWTIGFDTAHFADSLENWPFEAVHKEAVRLLEQCL